MIRGAAGNVNSSPWLFVPSRLVILLIAVALFAIAFWAVGRAPLRWRALIWVVVIAALVVPWSRWQDHAHWERVVWIPFASGLGSFRDVFLNVLLYVPLGFFVTRQFGRGRASAIVAVVATLALSLLTEWSQVYSHGRFPSATDVTTNGLGGMLGAWLGRTSSRGTADASDRRRV